MSFWAPKYGSCAIPRLSIQHCDERKNYSKPRLQLRITSFTIESKIKTFLETQAPFSSFLNYQDFSLKCHKLRKLSLAQASKPKNVNFLKNNFFLYICNTRNEKRNVAGALSGSDTVVHFGLWVLKGLKRRTVLCNLRQADIQKRSCETCATHCLWI